MSFSFNFRSVGDRSDITTIVDFLAVQNMDYPGYDAWVQRTEAELLINQKQGILASSEGKIAGNLIFQPHKTNTDFLELKNLRVHPELRRRGFAGFMLRQMEIEAQQQRAYTGIICDVRPEQTSVIKLLTLCGYRPVMTVPLYENHHFDVIMVKPLMSQVVIDSVRKLIVPYH